MTLAGSSFIKHNGQMEMTISETLAHPPRPSALRQCQDDGAKARAWCAVRIATGRDGPASAPALAKGGRAATPAPPLYVA
eukprot:CAMPEP_0202036156 /NCGR_PEP_ID=MMETSP0962-20130828/1375_1 /ASSEMBLY_ACC=CAM_ASM_000488 /TAXON_ID=4773 /ORGANISM="Schizochytrium aggregatum, Strain ATCC28209" /LENGTH=79 /DNA_ID=CAMNT_0048600223 /DNA_START=120 /DNA_END=359 /DNA_ORIENTATION=-